MINSNLIANGLVFKMNLKRNNYLEEIKITPHKSFNIFFVIEKQEVIYL